MALGKSASETTGLAKIDRMTNFEPMAVRIELSNSEFYNYFVYWFPQIENFKWNENLWHT